GDHHATGLAANDAGDIFFADSAAGGIYRIDSTGNVSMFATSDPGEQSLAVGPDEKLYDANLAGHYINFYDANGKATLLTRANCGPLTVSHEGKVYFIDPDAKTICLLDDAGRSKVVAQGIAEPAGLQLVPDQTLLQ